MHYEANPLWLPRLLERLVLAVAAWHGEEVVDIVAFSRGVQAFLYCLAGGMPLWLKNVANVHLIGGCLWQRQE